MTEYELESLPGAQLFQLCAEHLDEGRRWEEFVRRYNGTLVRAVYRAYRRFAPVEQRSEAAVADTLQEVYLELLKDDCQALRRFQGETAAAAAAYLAHTAMYVTVSHLRRTQTFSRQVEIIRLEDWLGEDDELERHPELQSVPPKGIPEYEVIDLLRRTFTSPNGQHNIRRNILLFLLHMYDGLTADELEALGICDLKATSISNLLTRMKVKLKKHFSQ